MPESSDELHAMASWERLVKLRENAPISLCPARAARVWRNAGAEREGNAGGAGEQWFNNLRHRARCPTRFHTAPDIHQCPTHPRPAGKLYPVPPPASAGLSGAGAERGCCVRGQAIRSKTFWLLTRSLELDWSLPFFLGFAAAIFTYLLSLYTQVL